MSNVLQSSHAPIHLVLSPAAEALESTGESETGRTGGAVCGFEHLIFQCPHRDGRLLKLLEEVHVVLTKQFVVPAGSLSVKNNVQDEMGAFHFGFWMQ